MEMDKLTGKIWFDGELVDWQEAKIHVLTHTLHYGLGVFEGVRAYQTQDNTAIFRLKDHTKRLFDSAKIMRMKMPYTQEQVNQAQIDVVKANQLKSAYIRPICFYGSQGMGIRAVGLKVHTVIAAWNWGAYLSVEGMKNGIKIKTSSYRRLDTQSSMTKAKTNGHYVNSILALTEALECGYDEALLLDSRGFVAEGSGENFFLIKDGIVYTPHTSNCLLGITRNTVIKILKDNQYKVVEKDITRDEVYIADEAFFVGTAAEVTPIASLDQIKIGSNTTMPGVITKFIQDKFFEIVEGKDDQYRDLLTKVY